MQRTFLEQLYFGNITPFDRKIDKNTRFFKLSKMAEKKHEEFREKLPGEMKKEFDEYIGLEMARASEQEFEAFLYSCRFALRFLLCCLGDEANEFSPEVKIDEEKLYL